MISPDAAARAAFLRFPLRVGARVGLRLLAPVLAGVFAAYYLLRPELILLFADRLLKSGDPLRLGLSMTIVSGLVGALIAPRVTLGLGGWIRHLPASARGQRWQAAAAILTAEAPILVPLILMAFLLPDKNGAGPAWTAAAGLAASSSGMALYLIPARQPLWASALLLGACILGGSGDPILLPAAAVAAGLADRATGPFLSGRRAGRRPLRLGSGPAAFAFRLSLRAAGARLLGSLLVPALFLGWAVLFLGNNPLAAGPARAAWRLAAGGGLAGALAEAASILAKRRPPWPWSRSLPLSARRRVAEDAVFLALPAVPALLAAAFLSPASLPAAALLPYAALRAAAAARPSMDSPRSPIPALFLELMLAAVLAALLPAALILTPAAAALAWREAARRERAVKMGRWLERRFAAGGDSLTWSSR